MLTKKNMPTIMMRVSCVIIQFEYGGISQHLTTSSDYSLTQRTESMFPTNAKVLTSQRSRQMNAD